MKKEIEDILKGMNRSGNINDETLQLRDMAKLLAILTEEQVKSTAKMENQTKHMIFLTRAIVFLTIILCFFTVELYQRTKTTKQNISIDTHKNIEL